MFVSYLLTVYWFCRMKTFKLKVQYSSIKATIIQLFYPPTTLIRPFALIETSFVGGVCFIYVLLSICWNSNLLEFICRIEDFTTFYIQILLNYLSLTWCVQRVLWSLVKLTTSSIMKNIKLYPERHMGATTILRSVQYVIMWHKKYPSAILTNS